MRVVVIGGGVMGCATALELAKRGVSELIVLERAVPGAEASSAAAGMLAAQVESKDDDERSRYVRARAAYAGWAEELRALTGIDIAYRKSGVLELASTDAELTHLRDRVASNVAAGLAAELVDPAGARAIEPQLGTELTGAAWFPDEAQIDPPQLLRALVAAVARAGITVKSGVTVSSLHVERDACRGVVLDRGDILHADAVLLAAGSWSSLVPGVPKAVPAVRPVRGQLVQLEERPPRLSRIVFRAGGYVVPRGDGRIICGSTMEDVGHRREVTAAGVHAILGAAIRIAPALAQAEMSRVWCNFRPHASGGPLVGASPLAGLFLATGHHRNGILQAKITAEAAAASLLAA
ncbi:MAG: FAD-dependent oxidoreductase [Labilithrix sp.]